MPRRRLELLFVLILIALLGLWARQEDHPVPGTEIDLFSYQPTIPTPELPQLTVMGVALGMSEYEAVDAVRAHTGSQSVMVSETKEGFTLIHGPQQVQVDFEPSGRARRVIGPSLEFAGNVLLDEDDDPDRITEHLGPPDSVGLDGVTRIEGAYGGYRYRDLGLTVAFRWDGPNQVVLGGY